MKSIKKYSVLHLVLVLMLMLQVFCVENIQVNNVIDSFSRNERESIDDPDKELERIRRYIMEAAEENSRHSNVDVKKIKIGALSDAYPEEMRQKAKQTRQNKKISAPVMMNPTAVWRTCVFPVFKINYVSWCKYTFGLEGNHLKVNGCLNNYCKVCCDNLHFQFKDIANKYQIGKKLLLNDELGFQSIKFIISEREINECRLSCDKNYHLARPQIAPAPPRFRKLGLTPENPALSCADIKLWGDESAKSGIYWVDIGRKGKQKVYCDMETNGGGWTLFFNYVHRSGEDISINSTILPEGLDKNSHMNLINAGFSNSDIKELRFFCKESFNNEKVYWHFKTVNGSVIKTAMTGDQKNLVQLQYILDGYFELDPPMEINGIYKKKVYPFMKEYFSFIGDSPNGGLYATPFGSKKYGLYWTVKGSSLKFPKYECASRHDYTGGLASLQSSPNLVESHHSVFFRGDAPKEDFQRARIFQNIKANPF